MVSIIHILTILFAVALFIIIKKERYKVVPLISLIVLISFIGCGIISIVSLAVPYGEIIIYPLVCIILGLIFILIVFNDFYSFVMCKDKIDGIYRGYNTYYGGNGVSTHFPIFEYTYNGNFYQEQTTQSDSYKHLTQNMRNGETYSIYVNPKHPAVFIFSKRLKASSIITIIFGILFFIAGISMLFVIF